MTTIPPSFPKAAVLGAALALCALGLASCKKVDEALPAAPTRVQVDTVPVASISVPDVLRLTGTLRGERETDLAANVAGRVVQVFVERGERIKRGQLLARVDVSAAALQLAEARVQIATSKTQQEIDQVECDRYSKLRERGAVTDLEYASVMARCKKSPLAIEAAQAKADTAAKGVGDGMIRAPFAGVVMERFVEVGEYVQPSTRVASLAEENKLRLEFSVPEADYPAVRTGVHLNFRVVAYGDRPFHGVVSTVGGAVRETRDVLVEATVENEDGVLLPGMFANVELPRGTLQRPAVPLSALFEQNGKQNLFVVDAGVLGQRVVQLEAAPQGTLVPVRSGISVGDRVVAARRKDLTNGMLVQEAAAPAKEL